MGIINSDEYAELSANSFDHHSIPDRKVAINLNRIRQSPLVSARLSAVVMANNNSGDLSKDSHHIQASRYDFVKIKELRLMSQDEMDSGNAAKGNISLAPPPAPNPAIRRRRFKPAFSYKFRQH